MSKMPYIKVYKDFLPIVRALDNGARGRLFLAVMEYANGTEPDALSGAEGIAYLVMKGQIDRDQSAQTAGISDEERAEINRQNGRKGGRPAKPKTETENPKTETENPAKPKTEKTYKDKDKEEDKDNNKDEEGRSTAASAAPAFGLPLIDGTVYGVQQTDVDRYASLFPAVDVPQELRKMIGWLDANPSNRKTKTGIARFINNWLSREQDRARVQKKPSAPVVDVNAYGGDW